MSLPDIGRKTTFKSGLSSVIVRRDWEVFLVTQELSTYLDRLYNNGTYTLDIHTEEDERIWSIGRL